MEKSGVLGRDAGTQNIRMERLQLTDVLDGLVAVFALRGIRSISAANDRVDQSMQLLVPSIEQLAKDHNLVLCFRIRLHPIHGDSQAVQDALFSTTQMGFITWDSPGNRDMRIKISQESAEALLSQLPGDRHMYEALAEEFLTYYRNLPA